MDTRWINGDQDSLLKDLIQTCNDLCQTTRQAMAPSVAKGYCGPLRWQHVCDQTIAMPRQLLTFELKLETTTTTDFDDVFRVRLHRSLPSTLVFDRIVSVEVNKQSSRPTNHSLGRTFDLAFNRIAAGSIVAVTYQARVHFDTEPTPITLDNWNLDWSWVSRSRKLIADSKHSRLPMSHRPRAHSVTETLQPS